MTSRLESVYVWIWLPGKARPVVAGVITRNDKRFSFTYGKSYLARADAISINNFDLPLVRGVIDHSEELGMASSLRDSSLDTWGKRVILNRLHSGSLSDNYGTADLDELTYLVESGSDRIGAIDFQLSATDYIARASHSTNLAELQRASELVEGGVPLTPELELALGHAAAIGGARPKALISSGVASHIAKFSSSTDLVSVVKYEFIAMRLASIAGLDVAQVILEKTPINDALLIRRFDRVISPDGSVTRKLMCSALTLFGLNEMNASYCSYETLTDIIRKHFLHPRKDLRELFGRLVFNILIGNTDDHGRNHAAFFDGKSFQLTPAYDICPQIRTGNEASQAMLIKGNANHSQLILCLSSCSKFLLSTDEAIRIIEAQMISIRENFDLVAQESGISTTDLNILSTHQVFNQFAFQGLDQYVHAGILALSDFKTRNIKNDKK